MHQAYRRAVGTYSECSTPLPELLLLYQEADWDLLITGALLHDIGKVQEYEVRAGIEITDIGMAHRACGDGP